MTSRRLAIALFLFTLPSPAGDFDRLAARWRSRITAVRSELCKELGVTRQPL